MRDGGIVRNSGGPPDDPSYPDQPGGLWDEWNSRNNGGDGEQNHEEWDGAASWAGSHPTGGGADPHWPQKWVNDMLADIRKHQVNREWQTIQLSPLPTVGTLEAWLISCKMDLVTASGRSDDWNISVWADAASDIKYTWNDLSFCWLRIRNSGHEIRPCIIQIV